MIESHCMGCEYYQKRFQWCLDQRTPSTLIFRCDVRGGKMSCDTCENYITIGTKTNKRCKAYGCLGMDDMMCMDYVLRDTLI